MQEKLSDKGSDIDSVTGNFIKRDKVSEVTAPNIKIGKEIARGGNSIVYEVKNNPDFVAIAVGENWGGVSPERLDPALKSAKQMVELYKNVPEDVNAPKITNAWVEKGRLFKLMEKAKGEPVHDRKAEFDQWQKELELIAAAPVEQYKKIVADVKTLSEAGLMIDPSKPDNIFYDKNLGFQIIDLGPGNKIHSLKVPLIHTYNFFTKYNEHIPEIKDSVLEIIDKLNQAGDLPNEYTEGQIKEMIDKSSKN